MIARIHSTFDININRAFAQSSINNNLVALVTAVNEWNAFVCNHNINLTLNSNSFSMHEWRYDVMAGGRGKKKRNSKDSTNSNGKKKGSSRKKGGGGGGGSSGKSGKVQGDIFSEGAMENAYLLCHNVQVSRLISCRWLFYFHTFDILMTQYRMCWRWEASHGPMLKRRRERSDNRILGMIHIRWTFKLHQSFDSGQLHSIKFVN